MRIERTVTPEMVQCSREPGVLGLDCHSRLEIGMVVRVGFIVARELGADTRRSWEEIVEIVSGFLCEVDMTLDR